MRASFSSLGMYSVAEAEIIENEINGVGGHAAPQIWLPLRIHVSHGAMGPEDGYEFISLSGQLVVDGVTFSNALPAPINTTIQPQFREIRGALHYLQFPLNPTQVNALERRRAGADLKIHLRAELEVMQLRLLGERPSGNAMRNPIWGQVCRHRLQLTADVSILRSAWIERVLPRVGFGLVHVLELPAIALDSCIALKKAFDALAKANELHKDGHYTEAVGRCRVALEEALEREEVKAENGENKTVTVPKEKWQERVGDATYEWLMKTRAAIKAECNPAVHRIGAAYSQFDSQMIIMVTTAVVVFAARVGSNERPGD